MATTITADSASISTTEYFINADSTSAEVNTDNMSVSFHLGLENMVAGDQYQIIFYEKAHGSATKRAMFTAVATGVSEDFVCPAIRVSNGWDIGVKRLAGSDRTIYWTIYEVAL
jgi:hypothetical protein